MLPLDFFSPAIRVFLNGARTAVTTILPHAPDSPTILQATAKQAFAEGPASFMMHCSLVLTTTDLSM